MRTRSGAEAKVYWMGNVGDGKGKWIGTEE